MSCPTSLAVLRANLDSLAGLSVYMELMERLEAARRGHALDQSAVRKIFRLMRAAFQHHATGEPRLREPLERKNPSAEWISWLQACLQRPFKETELERVIGGLDRELYLFEMVVTNLPPRLRQRAGGDFESDHWPQSIPVTRLSPKAEGDPATPVRCTRWCELEKYFADASWKIEWSEPGRKVARLRQTLDEFERDGVTDFMPSVAEVMNTIKSIVETHFEDWLVAEPLPEVIRNRLDIGNLSPPHQLKPQGLTLAVMERYRPIELCSTLINLALQALVESGWLAFREITRRPSDCSVDITERVLVPADRLRKGDGRASANSLSDRHRAILVAMLELAALDAASRSDTAKVAAKAEGPGTEALNLKAAISQLAKLGLIATKQGRSGGCWLPAPDARLTARCLRWRRSTIEAWLCERRGGS